MSEPMPAMPSRPTPSKANHASAESPAPAGPVSRRTLLRASLGASLLIPAGALGASGALASTAGTTWRDRRGAPGLLRHRPVLTHGVASGDPRSDGALVWTRADRPARMLVEVSPTDSFINPRQFAGPKLTPASDGTGRFRLTGLQAGQTVHYRVRAEAENGVTSEPLSGVFTSAPAAAQDIRFLWSGDVVGQGWGRRKGAGMPIFAAMAARQPDFFIHSGDAIYADSPVPDQQKQNDGAIYHNETSPAKSHVAQTVDDFRGNYQYNLEDPHYLNFNSSLAQIIQWDDHEVLNNWYPNESLAGQNRPGYTQLDVNTLERYAYQAWREWQPVAPSEAADKRMHRVVRYGPLLDVFVLDMRSYKDPNPADWGPEDDGGILGREQTQWLIDALRRSTATWKVIANDLPLSIVVPDGLSDPPGAGSAPGAHKSMEAVAQGDNGAPLGREIAFSRILSAVKNVKNIVFFTADVHYTAAISYHPDRAAFQDFSPFWEFVSGPLNAGAFPQAPLDATFGPQYEFVHAPDVPNSSPAEGFQHFGEVNIDGDSRSLTVHLRDTRGAQLYQKTLAAE